MAEERTRVSPELGLLAHPDQRLQDGSKVRVARDPARADLEVGLEDVAAVLAAAGGGSGLA